MCFSGGYNAIVEVNPTKNQDRYECNVVLDSGRTMTGEVLDPDGQPLAGVLVWGGNDFGGPWAHEPLSRIDFSSGGIQSGQTAELILFAQGTASRGEFDRSRREPRQTDSATAAVGGRLRAASRRRGQTERRTGDPQLALAETESDRRQSNRRASSAKRTSTPATAYMPATTDGSSSKDLYPAVNYNVGTADVGSKTYAVILEDTVLKPGEVRAVGDVRLQKMPTEGEREEKAHE